jgi:hypothetical protein
VQASRLVPAECLIREILVPELAKNANQSREVVSAARERWRQLRGLELAVKFSMQNKLYAPNSDAVIEQAMKDLRDGTRSQEDVAALIESAFFPQEPARVHVQKREVHWVTAIVVTVVLVLGVAAFVVLRH